MADDQTEPPEGGDPDIEPLEVVTRGVVTSRTLEPAVLLMFNDRKPITLAASNAREVAVSVLEAAISAEQDAMLVRYLTQGAGMTLSEAGAVLLALRDFRTTTPEGGQQP